MPVQEVYPHRRLCRQSARASLHRAAPRASLGQEGHSKCLWPVPCVRGSPTLSRLCHPPMLSHNVNRHRSRHYLLPTLLAVKPSLLALPVGVYLPCDPSPVGHLRLIPHRLEGAADYTDCLTEICPQPHPIKQAKQGVERTLDPEGL